MRGLAFGRAGSLTTPRGCLVALGELISGCISRCKTRSCVSLVVGLPLAVIVIVEYRYLPLDWQGHIERKVQRVRSGVESVSHIERMRAAFVLRQRSSVRLGVRSGRFEATLSTSIESVSGSGHCFWLSLHRLLWPVTDLHSLYRCVQSRKPLRQLIMAQLVDASPQQELDTGRGLDRRRESRAQ